MSSEREPPRAISQDIACAQVCARERESSCLLVGGRPAGGQRMAARFVGDGLQSLIALRTPTEYSTV